MNVTQIYPQFYTKIRGPTVLICVQVSYFIKNENNLDAVADRSRYLLASIFFLANLQFLPFSFLLSFKNV